jgi:hypothetical protein
MNLDAIVAERVRVFDQMAKDDTYHMLTVREDNADMELSGVVWGITRTSLFSYMPFHVSFSAEACSVNGDKFDHEQQERRNKKREERRSSRYIEDFWRVHLDLVQQVLNMSYAVDEAIQGVAPAIGVENKVSTSGLPAIIDYSQLQVLNLQGTFGRDPLNDLHLSNLMNDVIYEHVWDYYDPCCRCGCGYRRVRAEPQYERTYDVLPDHSFVPIDIWPTYPVKGTLDGFWPDTQRSYDIWPVGKVDVIWPRVSSDVTPTDLTTLPAMQMDTDLFAWLAMTQAEFNGTIPMQMETDKDNYTYTEYKTYLDEYVPRPIILRLDSLPTDRRLPEEFWLGLTSI